MAITRITIENFRSVERCELHPGALCALVGENNAGKSNILRAVQRVLGGDWAVRVRAFEDDDFFNHETDRDIVIELAFDPPLTYQAFKGSDPAEIATLRFTVTRYKVDSKQGKKGDRRLDTECINKAGTMVQVLSEAPKTGQKHKYKPLIGIPQEVRNQVPLIFIGSDRRLEDQMPTRSGSLLRRLLEDVDAALRTTPAPMTEGDTVLRTAYDLFVERLGAVLEILRIPEFVELETVLRERALENMGFDPKKDVDRMKFQFGLLDSFDFFKAMRLVVREGTIDIEAIDMGEGAQNALILAVFQAYEQLQKEGAIFLIEEPEMYLHPHRRRFLYSVLRSLSTRNQIIYTTHSTHFVAVPEYEDVALVYRSKTNTTKVRQSTLQPTAAIRERLRKEFDPERNELFFARSVILVEGDSEKLALPEYATRLEVDLNRAGCSVVEVGGKRSLKSFIEIISSFGIPLIVMFDTDSSDFGSDKEGERKFNEELRALAADRIILLEMSPDYESELRTALGEETYSQLCQKYSGVTKPIRARLIAQDTSTTIPKVVTRALEHYIAPRPLNPLT